MYTITDEGSRRGTWYGVSYAALSEKHYNVNMNDLQDFNFSKLKLICLMYMYKYIMYYSQRILCFHYKA